MSLSRCAADLSALLRDENRLTHFRTLLRFHATGGDTDVSIAATDERAVLPLVTVQCVEHVGSRYSTSVAI